jgi:hypothetical protein
VIAMFPVRSGLTFVERTDGLQIDVRRLLARSFNTGECKPQCDFEVRLPDPGYSVSEFAGAAAEISRDQFMISLRDPGPIGVRIYQNTQRRRLRWLLLQKRYNAARP